MSNVESFKTGLEHLYEAYHYFVETNNEEGDVIAHFLHSLICYADTRALYFHKEIKTNY